MLHSLKIRKSLVTSTICIFSAFILLPILILSEMSLISDKGNYPEYSFSGKIRIEMQSAS